MDNDQDRMRGQLSPFEQRLKREADCAAKDARIAQLETELAEARKDGERLDWLERRRLALNSHYGTSYGWKFVASCNVNRIFVKDVNTLDLHDSEAKRGDIRAAIDAAMKEAL